MNKLFTIMLGLVFALTAKAEEGKKAEVNWISLAEAEKLMAQHPKKVLVDVYTDWCGWCKVMDRKTYANEQVINYINEHFYAIKINAEQKSNISFKGRTYSYNASQRANEFATMLLNGKLSYPTTVLMIEGFQNVQPIPGFQDPANMELILKYIGDEHYKTTPFADYQKNFKASWGGKPLGEDED